MKSQTRTVLIVVVLLAIIAGVWYYRASKDAVMVPLPTAQQAPPAAAEPAPAASGAVTAMPEPASAAAPTLATAAVQPLQPENIDTALAELMGGTASLAQVQTDQFPRRLAATVDNLGRSFAPAGMWPVTPTPGRFSAVDSGGSLVIAPDNYQRYDAFVAMVDKLDAAQAAQFVARMQPLLQSAYTNLGYPNSDFRKRLVAVIDQLLATPKVQPPVKLTLVEVKGEIPSTRPWVRYRFADPKLEALSAGQKVLIRMGPDHAAKVEAKLRAIRSELLK
ncbi:MAG: DUF3014 domain-containing protein [Pseudomonadota bacterium]|nr:DUF3014 domain-containing protein [Pseudomonadota bacterium]